MILIYDFIYHDDVEQQKSPHGSTWIHEAWLKRFRGFVELDWLVDSRKEILVFGLRSSKTRLEQYLGDVWCTVKGRKKLAPVNANKLFHNIFHILRVNKHPKRFFVRLLCYQRLACLLIHQLFFCPTDPQEKVYYYLFMVHYNIPFVDDIRVIVDWTVVSWIPTLQPSAQI